MNSCEQNVIWAYLYAYIAAKVTTKVKNENIDHHHPARHGDAMMLRVRAASSRTSQPSACQTRVRSQIMPGIPGYPSNSHIRRRCRNKKIAGHDAAKSPTGGRCINTLATRISNSPDAGWAYILSGSADADGFALRGRCSCAGNVWNGQGTAG